jgi:Fe-S cluster assembly protein SufD
MTAAVHPYVGALLAGSAALPRGPADWLAARRAAALERANALAVPSTREEDWRFTDLAPLTRTGFQPAPAEAAAVPAADIERFALPEAAARLTFVDGAYAPALSDPGALPPGVRVLRLADALKSGEPALEAHLARHAAFDADVFAAVNTAWLRDGACVVFGRGAALAAPLHLLFVATRAQAASHPRCLVLAGEGADGTLVEDYVALAEAAYFVNAVTEIAVSPGARVRHVRLQRESPEAFHIASCAVSLARDARYESHSVALGARLSRYNLALRQTGEGAAARIDGLALIGGRQLADTHTLMDHAQPHGRCEQRHKTIVDGAAHAVFNGKVVVRQGAQLTDSSQQSRNLLLSPRARVDAKPQLEIFADDVKCAHGATVGQLDPEQLFYLRSRGLSAAAARSLLTYAFGAEIIDRIPVPSLVARLERAVMAQTRSEETP